ncbi:MAG: LD-carboxypeptidase [Pseudomonadota bacterium]
MRPLYKDDVIGVVSPASSAELSVFKTMKEIAEQQGFRLKVFGAGEVNFGRMSATDERRLMHLRDAFHDEEVRAVVCARGGYGSGRLLKSIQPDLAKDKIFVGYSDATNLLLHLNKHAGIIPFHGPMVSDLAQKQDPRSIEWFFSTLKGERLSYTLSPQDFTLMRAGKACGPVFGGNISTIETLVGTDSLTVPEGAILMLEDVNEFMYKFDRALVHLDRAGFFDNAAGIIFGDLRLKDDMNRDNSLGLLLEEVLDVHFGKFNGPVVYKLPCGHTAQQMTLPIGTSATLDARTDQLKLEYDDFWDRTAVDTIAA